MFYILFISKKEDINKSCNILVPRSQYCHAVRISCWPMFSLFHLFAQFMKAFIRTLQVGRNTQVTDREPDYKKNPDVFINCYF